LVAVEVAVGGGDEEFVVFEHTTQILCPPAGLTHIFVLYGVDTSGVAPQVELPYAETIT
jgi:hypothetical protein